MKRKFAFGLPPLKIPSKMENQKLKDALSAYGSLDHFSPPSSPFIDRQFVDYRTEAALRSACAAVVVGVVIPADDEDLHRIRALEAERKSNRSTDRAAAADQRKLAAKDARPEPTQSAVPPHQPKNAHDKTKRERLSAPVTEDQQQRARTNFADRKSRSQSNIKSSVEQAPPDFTRVPTGPEQRTPIPGPDVASPYERPKTAPGLDSTDLSYATPLTASTGKVANYASTAVTSAAMTPARPSHRGSEQSGLDKESQRAQADADAAEWMRKELEKRRRQQEQQHCEAEAHPKQPPSARSRSRTRSFTSEIREYIRPRTASASRSGSRPPSRDALHQTGSGLNRKPSFTEGWRSWTLQRKPSKTNLNEPRPGLVAGQNQPAGKKEINLNRELPPLPSIDTWQDSAERKKPADSHVASMMKSKDSTPNAQIPPKLERRDPRSLPKLHTGIVIPATKLEDLDTSAPSPSPLSHPLDFNSNSDGQDSCFSPVSSTSAGLGPRSVDVLKAVQRVHSDPAIPHQPVFSQRKDSLINRKTSSSLSKINSASKSTTSLNDLTSSKTAGTTATTTISTTTLTVNGALTSHPPSATIASRPATRAGDANAATTNFSRKISYEQYSRPPADPRFPAIADITALPPMPAKPKKNGLASLRKALSNLNFGGSNGSKQQREHQAGWMEHIELEGVKQGVLIQGDAAMAPVVRY